jgi:hypothetical protein
MRKLSLSPPFFCSRPIGLRVQRKYLDGADLDLLELVIVVKHVSVAFRLSLALKELVKTGIDGYFPERREVTSVLVHAQGYMTKDLSPRHALTK